MASSATSGLARLRERIRAIETGGAPPAQVLPFGSPALDAALPGGGLARGALHEILGAGGDEEDAAASAAFAAGILARLAGDGAVLWCLAAGDLYGAGLAASGLGVADLVVARGRSDADILWAMEEGLRAPGLAAVIGEVGVLDATASRRLQLAAEASGVTALALRRWRTAAAAARHRALPTAAATRWRVAAAPSRPEEGEPGVGRVRWRLDLLRCRGGIPAAWLVEPGPGGRLAVVGEHGRAALPPAHRAGDRRADDRHTGDHRAAG
jgi:protein ImuA